MLDVVAPDQDQTTASVDDGGIDDRETGLAAAAAGGTRTPAAETAQKRADQCKQGEHHDESDQASYPDVTGPQEVKHRPSLRLPAWRRERALWLTPAATFAASILTKD